MTDVDTIAASLGSSNCSLYKAYATQLSRITKVKPIVASLNSQITELLVRYYIQLVCKNNFFLLNFNVFRYLIQTMGI